jgi:hypothetical protein
LKGELKNWNRNAFGNIQNQVANSVAKLLIIFNIKLILMNAMIISFNKKN